MRNRASRNPKARRPKASAEPAKGFDAQQEKPAPVYIATPREPYRNLEFSGTPTHPQMRDHYFLRNVQLDVMRKQASKGKPYYESLMAAVGMHGASRRRIELERGIAERVGYYNDIASRMNEQLGETIDQLVLPFPPPRTRLHEYDDVKALAAFVSRHWGVSLDGNPLPESVVRKHIELAYGIGRDAEERRFAAEYKGPGYDEGFAKQAGKLIAKAQRAVKAGKLK